MLASREDTVYQYLNATGSARGCQYLQHSAVTNPLSTALERVYSASQPASLSCRARKTISQPHRYPLYQWPAATSAPSGPPQGRTSSCCKGRTPSRAHQLAAMTRLSPVGEQARPTPDKRPFSGPCNHRPATKTTRYNSRY
jgi:hypothetical protein